MVSLVNLSGGLSNPVGLSIRASAREALVATRAGLVAVDLTGGAHREIAVLPGGTNAVAVNSDESLAYVVGTQIGLQRVVLDGSKTSSSILKELVRPSSVLVHPTDEAILVAEGSYPGRLYSVRESPLTAAQIGRRLEGVRGMVVERATGRIISTDVRNGGLLVEPTPIGPPTTLVSGLGLPIDIAWLDESNSLLIVADGAAGRVLGIDLTRPNASPVELFTDIDGLWAVRPLDASTLIVGAGDALLVGTLRAGPGGEVEFGPTGPVELRIPDELFLGGWVRTAVVIHDDAIAFDDLEFVVTPTESAAMVSYSKDGSFDPVAPSIVLISGWMAGEHNLIARQRSTGIEVGQARFEVKNTWEHSKWGPSLAVLGTVEGGYSAGTYGGPDSGDKDAPQNVAVVPALGMRNIGVALIETSDVQFAAGSAATIITDLRNEIVNGVTVVAGAPLRSVSTYFQEASGGEFSINLVGIVGPIALPNNWDTYFGPTSTDEQAASAMIAEIVAENEAAAQRGDPPVLDLRSIDSMVYVMASLIATPPATADVFAWPRASIGGNTEVIGHNTLPGPIPIPIPVHRNIARIFMPHDWWTANRSTRRRFHDTLSHELGHNLGLQDQYARPGVSPFDADAVARIADNGVASWELMSWEENLPLPSTGHRLQLGWLDPAKVRLYNFGHDGRIVRDPLTLVNAGEGGANPTSSYSAAEVRIEDGRNFYLEYRPSSPRFIFDQAPPEAATVVITDFDSRVDFNSSNRPKVLLVPEDADGVVDRGAFAAGEDFIIEDPNTPLPAQNLVVDVVATTAPSATAAGTATVEVTYADVLVPDPSLTPYSARTNWRSPDIEVSNARSQADPSMVNVPWEGHDNTVTARVENRGSVMADAVTVSFYFKDFTFNGGKEAPLGSDTHDVEAGATVTFTAPNTWKPTALPFPYFISEFRAHGCIVARIDPYTNPVTNVQEVTAENNEAQSNYGWNASTTASPATREASAVRVSNPYLKPAVVAIIVDQPHPLFRVYLSHRWVYLQPGEEQQILVMIESLEGDDRFAALTAGFPTAEKLISTTLRLTGTGDTRDSCTQDVLGGVGIATTAGVGTQFVAFEAQSGECWGRIVRVDTGAGVDGRVLISIRPRDPKDPRAEVVRDATVAAGSFGIAIGPVDKMIVQGHYLGRAPCGPCDSRIVEF